MRFPIVIVQALLLLATSLSFAKADDSESGNALDMLSTPLKSAPTYDYYRLPTSVRPIKYTLQVVTHLEDPNNLHYYGEVMMQLEVLEQTKNITLHAQNLTIDAQRIKLTDLHIRTPANCIRSIEIAEHHDYFIMHLCNDLIPGDNYLLRIPFAAELNHKLRGYYKSSYLDKVNNVTRWLSITQFEPAFARAAFPCFDEPEYKARFTIILGHHQNYTALSNMPLKESRPMGKREGWLWSEFQESVPMSTYLVAYTINDFSHVRSKTNLKNNVQFRTWARPDAISQCNYAAVIGPQVLEYYEDIFDIKFPLEKIDQIAIPDFSAGAMENWGLVTYRETALLYAENVSSVANKQRVASVVAHELAHQWFGNLVTMKWWTDLWLNEGFATYVASLGVEHISPEWKSLEEESVDNALAIFKLDALKSSHPISQPIYHASEIYEIFDSISYKKGSTVLRMMHMFMGDTSFRSGIYSYLKKHAYGNAEQNDLWSALTDAAHKYRSLPDSFNIKTIMDSWTLQTGYPIIVVNRDYEGKTATISQSRYLLDTDALRSAIRNCWWVPLSYTSQDMLNFQSTQPKEWLQCSADSSSINKTINDMPTENDWIIFNIQMTGLYKVKYDERNWNMLIDTLMSSEYAKIHFINRAQLIDDALSLAWSGDQNYDIAMRLIEYLIRETEYIPWKAALENLSGVYRVLRQTPQYEFFKKYMKKILTPVYIHLQGLNDTYEAQHSKILHRVLIASWACRFEVEDCVPHARALFDQWRNVANPDEQNPISSDFRSVIYCTAIRHGTDTDWNFLWARYKNSNVAAEKRTILLALGCSREVWVLQRYLEWSFDETSHIRKQDSFFAFGSVARGEVGFHLAKDYFLSNLAFLHQFYEPDSSDLARLLSPLASQMITKHEYESFKNFTEQNKHLLRKAEQGVRRALETIQINVQWKENKYNEISRNLKAQLSN